MAGPGWVQSTFGQNSQNYFSSVRSHGGLTEDERFFVENHERAETIAEGSGSDAYEYDDYALCLLDGTYYVFNTSGCSCPSPSETWYLDFKGTSLELLAYLDTTTPGSSAWNDFLRNIEKAGVALLTPAPEPGKRYDW